MATSALTIGKFAAAAGVGVETVRFYQRRGLLGTPAARRTSYREYDEALLQRVRFIRQAQAAGFTLAEIRELIRLDRTSDRTRIRGLAAAKLDDLRERSRALRRAMQALEALVHDCDHAKAGSPCPIVDAFDAPGGHAAHPSTLRRGARSTKHKG